MQMPIHPQAMLQKRHTDPSSEASENDGFKSTQPATSLSFESQVQLRSLREYIGQCRSVLDEIRTNLNGFKKNPVTSDILSTTAIHLSRFCLEADCWGFNALYDVAFALQKTLQESGVCGRSSHFWEAVHKGLVLMSAMVEQAEIDFRKNLALDDTLESLRRVNVQEM